jgi:hypothetical protein
MGIGALLVAALVFVGYSVVTSKRMDNEAASVGSSTDPKAPNTLQDRPRPEAPGAASGPMLNTNIPPATPQQR